MEMFCSTQTIFCIANACPKPDSLRPLRSYLIKQISLSWAHYSPRYTSAPAVSFRQWAPQPPFAQPFLCLWTQLFTPWQLNPNSTEDSLLISVEETMMLHGWQHIKLSHTCTSEEKYSCLCSALGSVEMKKKLFSFTFPASLWMSSTISYKFCLSQIPAEIKRTLCMKEEDHSFFSMRELCDHN